MSPGKAYAQSGHAWVDAYQLSYPGITQEWNKTGKTKVALLGEDELHLHAIEKYITERGYKVVPIIDEGRTEVRPHSFTALGVEIVDKDDPDVQFTFGGFRLYKPVKSAPKKGLFKGK